MLVSGGGRVTFVPLLRAGDSTFDQLDLNIPTQPNPRHHVDHVDVASFRRNISVLLGPRPAPRTSFLTATRPISYTRSVASLCPPVYLSTTQHLGHAFFSTTCKTTVDGYEILELVPEKEDRQQLSDALNGFKLSNYHQRWNNLGIMPHIPEKL